MSIYRDTYAQICKELFQTQTIKLVFALQTSVLEWRLLRIGKIVFHVCTHIYIYIYKYIYMCVHMKSYFIYIYIYICAYLCLHLLVSTYGYYICLFSQVYLHTHGYDQSRISWAFLSRFARSLDSNMRVQFPG